MAADDNPFASLGAEDYSSPPLADPAADPFANLKNPDLPRVGPAPATGLMDLVRHPIAAGSALLDYARARAADAALHHSSVGGAAGLAGDALQQAQDAEYAARVGIKDPQGYAAQEHARRVGNERAGTPAPAGSVPEAIAGFAGDVGGTILAPESMIALPEKALAIAGRPVLSAIARHAAGGALGNTAADLASQGTQLARGYQEDYDPFQTLLAPVEGAVAGTILGGAHEGIKAVGEVGHALRGAIPDHAPAPPMPATWTVDNLWPRLAHQEHGVDAEGHSLTSPKGARGPAQLMPETAREVAQSLGQPQLAEIALGDGPSANVANEMLGRTYLGHMLHLFDGDPAMALAAYNAGPGKVHEWVRTFGDPDEVGRARWLSMIPYKETRDYVHTILGSAAGEPHVLTPDDHAYMRGRMEQFPQEPEVALPPLERAATAADEAAQAHTDIGPFPDTLQPTGEFSSGIPWDGSEHPVEKSAPPSPKEIPEGQDFTDQALDQLRSRQPLRMGEGPSLIEALVKAGGLKDAGGELADILGGAGGNRLQKMLRRVRSGMDLDQAAEWAQERGYIGRTTDAYAEAAGPNELLEAIRREVAGEKVFPADRINEHARALQEHMVDLDEIVNHLGIDLEKHSNPEVRRQMDDWMNGPEHQEEPGALGMKDTGEVLGMGGHLNGGFDVSRPWGEFGDAYGESIAAARRQLATLEAAAVPDTRGEGQQYHGARGDIPKLDEGYYNPDNIYGGQGTFYTTDAMDIARGYGRKNPNAAIFKTHETRPIRLFDMEERHTVGEWEKLLYGQEFRPDGSDAPSHLSHELMAIEEAAGDHGGKPNLREIMDEIRQSSAGEGYSKDDVQEMFAVITEQLERHGYGGMSHTGGLRTGKTPHTVKIYFHPETDLNLERVGLHTAPEAEAGIAKARQAVETIQRVMDEHKAAHDSAGSRALRARDAHQRAELRNEIMASTRAGMLRGSREPVAVPAPRDAAGVIDVGAVPKVQGVPEIIRTLADALGYPVRQGRISLRNALGTYNRRSGMVRSKGRYDLNVLAHEFGHALEFTDGHGLPNVMAAMKAHAAALKRMDYNQSLTVSRGPNAGKPPAGRRHEGFAEWFRWYITNPAYADTMPGATAFRHDFEAAMAKDDPKGLAAIQAAQRSYQAFLEAPSLAATREHVVAPASNHPLQKLLQLNETKGPIGALKDLGDEAYRGVVDFLHPWKKAVEFAEGVVQRRHGFTPKLAANADPYKLLRSMASVSAVGHMDLIHGVHGYQSLEPESPSFAKALAAALGDKFLRWDEGAIRDFGTYLVGKRVLNLYDSVGKVWTDDAGRRHGLEAPPDALSRRAWAQTVSDLEEMNPHWAAAADQLYEWNNALWKKRRDSGLIGDGEYLAGLEDHPNYVPLFRDISDKEFGGDVGGQKGSGTKNAGGVVQLKGSDRAYINPLHSMMNMAYEMNAQIARNDALKALDDLGQLLGPDIGQVVERIPAHQLVGTTTSVEEVIANAAKAYGVSRRDAAAVTEAVREMFGAEEDDAMNAAVYRAKAVGENGEPIVYVWREGQRIPLRLPDGQWGKHMVEGLAGMTQPIRSVMLDLASIPAAALRAGVTAHPAFFLANSFRDQMSAFVLTNVGYRPFIDQARGLGHEMGNHIPGLAPDDLTRIYNVASGEIGGYQSAAAHEAHAEKNLQALRQKGASIRHFATWNGFAHFTEVSETGTRLGIFERALKDAKDRGFSPYAAAREAAFEARDYMDFDRHGGWTPARVLARVIPFMNAGIQALDKTRRVAGGISLLPKVIAPIFGKGPPATAEEYREFSHAMKLWITASALAVGGLSIRAAYRDDPEYEELADTLRNTHWVVKLPNGYFAAIPKPYEIAVLSNIFERAFEATALHDSTAWGRLMQGLEDIFIPAHDPAFLMPAVDVMRNRDNLGSPIVPDYLKAKLAKDQYTDRTSDISKWLGGHLGGEEGISPAVIDFLAKSWGGSNMRDVLDANHQRAPVADSPADTFVEKRFVKDWTRGAVSSKQFYDLVSASDGRWSHAVASLDGLVNDGKYPEAVKRLHAMDAPERSYVMASIFAKGEQHDERDRHHGDFVKQDHPMIRAQAAASAFAGFARDLMDGNVRGPDLQPIPVTPEQRRDTVRALRELAVSEQRNGMILAGVEGWQNRKPLPETRYLLDLERAAPQLMPALVQRFKDEKVQDIALTAKNWSAARNMLESAHDEAVLTGMMQAKRFPEAKSGQPTSAAMKRAMSDVVPATR